MTTLENHGLVDVHIEDQAIEGYNNAPFRFNCWGFVGGDDASRATGGG